MLGNKNLTAVIAVIMAICCAAFIGLSAFGSRIKSLAGETGIEMEYEEKLFNTSQVLDINIVMDESEWETMLANAMSETYYQCNVEISGETFYSVGIRPKGNTSLSTIVNDPDTDRYSFKLEFDQFVTGQSCYGLDKLILNNNYADATNMKEALIYDMFAEVGADASLYNYAKISVNGEYWGIYLALEAVEDSFMLRNYGAESGELYKPDSMEMGGGMGGGNRGGMDFGDMPQREQGSSAEENRQMPDTENFDFSQFAGGEMPDMGNFDFSDFGGGKGGFSMGGSGTNLNYSDDDPDSYSAIWEGEVTSTNSADHKRVVTALKNISEGNDLEKYMDVDNLLRYAAVHIFSENSDSLSGSMSHNYYLYESGGRLNLLPWDYNLALGGMNGGSATDVVNSAIDDAWNGTNFFDTLMENEEYHAEYYAYLEQIAGYILEGGFEEFYTRTREQIDSLVKADPNAFYGYDEYLAAVETFYEVVTLRGESIKGQLGGSIPSYSAEQRDSAALIDASHLDLSTMGSMNMGGGFGGDFGSRGERPNTNTEAEPETEANTQSAKAETLTAQSLFAGGFNGQPPEGFDGQMPEGFEGGEMPNFGGEAPTEDGDTSENDNSSTEEIQPGGGAQSGAQNSRPNMGSFPGQSGSSALWQNIILYAVSAAIFAAAFTFALLYKRKKLR